MNPSNQGPDHAVTFEPSTLWPALTLTSAAGCIGMTCLARYAPRVPGPAWWAGAFGCYTAALASLMVPLADQRWQVTLANLPTVLASVLLMVGALRFRGHRPPAAIVPALLAVALAVTIAFAWVWPMPFARIALTSTVTEAACGVTAYVLWRHPPGAGRVPARLAATTCALMLLAMVARVVWFVWAPVPTHYATNPIVGWDAVLYALVLAAMLLSAPAFVLVVAAAMHERLEAQIERAEESESLFRSLTAAAGIGILVTDADGACTYANPRLEQIGGFAPGSALGDGWRRAIAAADRPAAVDALSECARTGAAIAETIRIHPPGGGLRWVRARTAAGTSNVGRRRLLTTVEDITELRVSYDRVRELAQWLESIREDERRAIAVELHEGIAQELAAANLTAAFLRTAAAHDVTISDAVDEVAATLQRCIVWLRELTNELRPTVLAHLPLADAIMAHAREIGDSHGLSISVVSTEPLDDLDEDTRVALFRSAQEALGNVVRHARATAVEIELERNAGRPTLRISDDGIGVSDRDLAKDDALGLLAVQERLLARGGELRITRREPKGTVVTMHAAPTADQLVSRSSA